MSLGRSLSVRQNTFLQPPSDPKDENPEDEQTLQNKRRQVNVYDAVAGKYHRRPIRYYFVTDTARAYIYTRYSYPVLVFG